MKLTVKFLHADNGDRDLGLEPFPKKMPVPKVGDYVSSNVAPCWVYVVVARRFRLESKLIELYVREAHVGRDGKHVELEDRIRKSWT